MRDTTFFSFFETLFYTKLPFPLPWWSKISWWTSCRWQVVNFEIHLWSSGMNADCIWRSISIQHVQIEAGLNSDPGNDSFWDKIRDAKHVLIDLLTSTCRTTCRSTQVKIALTDLWPQEMFTFSEMLALVELDSSFGAYVCHGRPGGSTATSDLVCFNNVCDSSVSSRFFLQPFILFSAKKPLLSVQCFLLDATSKDIFRYSFSCIYLSILSGIAWMPVIGAEPRSLGKAVPGTISNAPRNSGLSAADRAMSSKLWGKLTNPTPARGCSWMQKLKVIWFSSFISFWSLSAREKSSAWTVLNSQRRHWGGLLPRWFWS